jgi:hypothetical protein
MGGNKSEGLFREGATPTARRLSRAHLTFFPLIFLS